MVFLQIVKTNAAYENLPVNLNGKYRIIIKGIQYQETVLDIKIIRLRSNALRVPFGNDNRFSFFTTGGSVQIETPVFECMINGYLDIGIEETNGAVPADFLGLILWIDAERIDE
jgi:hypothetical protein